MKRFYAILGMVTALLFSSCQKETGGEGGEILPPGDAVVYHEFPITVSSGAMDGEAGTRSLISIEAEAFKEAYLYAFDATTKEILEYGPSAGDMAGQLMAKYTTVKTFNWALPVGVPMDIWVIVNPGETAYGNGSIAQTLTDAELSESSLQSMVYRIPNQAEFIKIDTEDYGLPMSAMINSLTLNDYSQTVSIPAKRLFAKYTLSLNKQAAQLAGYNVTGVSVLGCRTNTEMPFFRSSGYAQTNPAKLATIDRATSAELSAFNDNGSEVTLYFLENCQGNKSGATKWTTVEEDLGDAVSLCSYVDLGIRFELPEGEDYFGFDRMVPYRIYLGKTDMKSNFDVEGNYQKHIQISIPEAIDYEFAFATNVNPIRLAPNTVFPLPFVWKGDYDPSFQLSNPLLASFPNGNSFLKSNSYGPKGYNGEYYSNSGMIYVSTSSSFTGEVTVTGGNLSADTPATDTKRIIVQPVTNEYFTFDRHSLTLSKGSSITLGFSASAASLDYLLIYPSSADVEISNVTYDPYTHRGSFTLGIGTSHILWNGFWFNVFGVNLDGSMTMDQINVTIGDAPTFNWNEHHVSVTPGSSYTLEFMTNAISENALDVICDSPYLSFDNLFLGSDGTGEISFDVLSNAPYTLAGSPIIVTGYNGSTSDVCEITIAPSTVPLNIHWEIVGSYEGMPYSDSPPALYFETVGNNTFNRSIEFYFKVRLKEDRYAGGNFVPVPNDFEIRLTNLAEGGFGVDDYVFYYNQVGVVNVTFVNGQATIPFSWDARMISGISTQQFDAYRLEVQYHGVQADPYGGYTVNSVSPGLGDNPLTWER